MKLTRIEKIRVKLSRVNFCVLISAMLIKWNVDFRDLDFHHFNISNSGSSPGILDT